MTYGEAAEGIRDTLIWLLERRRITQRIGGAGNFQVPVTSTPFERELLAEEIQVYRAAAVGYCLQALRVVTPPGRPTEKELREAPALLLRHNLEQAHARLRERSAPTLTSFLNAEPDFELVGRWQDLARLAVQGEREVHSLRRSTTAEQKNTIAADVADATRALAVLDRRYEHVSGWRQLNPRARLLAAATAVTVNPPGEADLSVDALGWQPPFGGAIVGPALPGIAGVLQVQHNVVADLIHFPAAHNLRRVLFAQAELSRQVERLAEPLDPALAAWFHARADTYRELVIASRTLGGEIGGGRSAALESAIGASRARTVTSVGPDALGSLRKLAQLDRRVDSRIHSAMEHGFHEHLFAIAVSLPILGAADLDGIHRAARHWRPADPAIDTRILELARSRLAPVTHLPAPARESHVARMALRAVTAMEPRVGDRPHLVPRRCM